MACRELLRNAQKIFTIFMTKPKFLPVILDGPPYTLWKWIESSGMTNLESIAYMDNLSSGIRVDAFETMQALIKLYGFLFQEVQTRDNPEDFFCLHMKYDTLVRCLTSSSTDMVVREASRETVFCLAKVEQILYINKGNSDLVSPALFSLCKLAQDAFALLPVWCMGVLNSPSALDTLINRIAHGSSLIVRSGTQFGDAELSSTSSVEEHKFNANLCFAVMYVSSVF